jgi:predicted oxidoreductase (fatty acid repression mutant protein)
MKSSNSAFNAQGSRVIIIVLQVGAVKIYVVEAIRTKER